MQRTGALTIQITEPRYPEPSLGKITAPCTSCTEQCQHKGKNLNLTFTNINKKPKIERYDPQQLPLRFTM